jgi:hypothetical protein
MQIMYENSVPTKQIKFCVHHKTDLFNAVQGHELCTMRIVRHINALCE